MNPRLITALVFTAVVASSFAHGQEARKAGDNPRAVLPHSRRMEALKGADDLLAIRPAGSQELVAALADPFYPGAKRLRDKKQSPGDEQPVALPAEQMLARAAESIRPQGTMIIGSEPYLLFENNRRYKAGDSIPVTIDGVGVQITVTSIQRNSYTLRLDDKELRREFK